MFGLHPCYYYYDYYYYCCYYYYWSTFLLFLAEVPFVRDIFVFRIVGPTHLEQTEDVEDAVSGSARRRDQAPQDADAAMAWNQAERRLKFY